AVLRSRTGGGVGHGRPVATILLLALIPVATEVRAIVALGLVAAVCVALIAYEAIRYRGARAWIRQRRGTFTIEEARQVAPNAGRRRREGGSGSRTVRGGGAGGGGPGD